MSMAVVSKARFWSSFSLAGLAVVGLSWFLGTWLGLSGTALWILRGGIFVIGTLIVLLVLRLIGLWPGRARQGRKQDDEIEEPVSSARRRLKATAPGGVTSIGKLPMIVILGPEGSAKTTVVARSGLEAELLAGEVERGDDTVPTRGVNLWYGGEAILLEAGGAVTADEDRWRALIKHLAPDRLAPAVSGRPQAPRLAVVCYSCEDLLQAGGGEGARAAARSLRARLSELSGMLGVRLPVYVLFTKADRILHFTEFVRNFTREEAWEPLGATLRNPLAPVDGGSYAEAQGRRLQTAFDGLFRSLALRRIEILSRAADAGEADDAYEFPREFRKVAAPAVDFLLELGRPSQLGVSPFLRGFYFTGVRPVVVSDGSAPPPPSQAPGPRAGSATQVLNAQAIAAGGGLAPRVSRFRRVPEWTFLARFFPDVVLGDPLARAATAGGTRVNFLRRGGLAAAAVLALVLAAGFTTSFRGNRGLQAEVIAAARAADAVRETEPALPTMEELGRLDALRERAELLGRYQREGRPLRLRWGLYTGNRILPDVRQRYFDAFERAMLRSARASVISSLATVSSATPPSGGSAPGYREVYDRLKAYLITSGYSDRSTPEFLAPILLERWLNGRDLDEERLALARRQFEFYGAELPHGDPFRFEQDGSLVSGARGYLRQSAGLEPFYQALVAEAGRGGSISFARDGEGGLGLVANGYEVPGAYTARGWAEIQTRLENLDLPVEEWVMGEGAVEIGDRAAMARQLRERYVSDYAAHWRGYLAAGQVTSFGSIRDAAQKMDPLSGNQSPLLRMLALASRNTDVDSAMAGEFEPLHAVMPPEVTDRYIVDANRGYMDALGQVHLALQQAADAPPGQSDMALGQAQGGVDQGKGAIRQLAQDFPVEGGARNVGGSLVRVLEAPLTGVERLIRARPAQELAGQGASLCSRFRPILALYPFNAGATREADIAQVAEIFQPGSSALWSFYDESLQPLLVKQGPTYQTRPGAPVQPTAEFRRFFNQAAEVSEALFTGADPRFDFALRIQTSAEMPEITVNIDGQSAMFTRTSTALGRFRWDGSRAQVVRVTGRVDGRDVTLFEAGPSPWAVFRFFQGAGGWQRTGDRHMVQWNFAQAPALRGEVHLGGRPPVFRSGYFAGLNCVSRVAQ